MDHIQALFAAQYPHLAFTAFAEFDGEQEVFTVIHNGEVIIADSLALLLSELQARTHVPLRLAA